MKRWIDDIPMPPECSEAYEAYQRIKSIKRNFWMFDMRLTIGNPVIFRGCKCGYTIEIMVRWFYKIHIGAIEIPFTQCYAKKKIG